MWKESYRVGVERIDTQHIELFRMADELLAAIDRRADKALFQQSIAFLKDYVVYHFRDEEAYQESIQYAGLEEHKKQHREFNETVLTYERALVESGFDLRVLKSLAGTLTAWLIYHVADADQKIVGISAPTERGDTRTCIETFCVSTAEVLEKMAGLSQESTRKCQLSGPSSEDDVFIRVKLIGDVQGGALFGYSRAFAFNLVRILTFMEVNEIDELVCSALSEIANIVSGNASTNLSVRGVNCDILPPELLGRDDAVVQALPEGGTLLRTEIGDIRVWVNID